jgi:hypothetical protein
MLKKYGGRNSSNNQCIDLDPRGGWSKSSEISKTKGMTAWTNSCIRSENNVGFQHLKCSNRKRS